jgi:hypothetical protein
MFEDLRSFVEMRARVQGLEQFEPHLSGNPAATWCGEDDCSKYEWRTVPNSINTWAEPRNANGVKVNGGPPPPDGSA